MDDQEPERAGGDLRDLEPPGEGGLGAGADLHVAASCGLEDQVVWHPELALLVKVEVISNP